MARADNVCVARGQRLGSFWTENELVEGPLLLLKAWGLSALMIWVYQRWFQRVAPSTPEFEVFCKKRPVVAALYGLEGGEAGLQERLAQSLGRYAVATLGTFPWPHYRLDLELLPRKGAVLVRVVDAQVLKSRDQDRPALTHALRDALNDLPEGAECWLHTGTFDNGLLAPPPGGWALRRGAEKRPRLEPRDAVPAAARASFGFGEPEAALLAGGHRVDHAVPRVAR